MDDFQQVKVYSNWGYWDSVVIDGDHLEVKPGRYEIRWPDGHVSTEDVVTHSINKSGNDMGHPIEIPYVTAYAKMNIHGAIAEVRLLNLFIRRVTNN